MPFLLVLLISCLLTSCDNYSDKIEEEIQRAKIIQEQLAWMEEEKKLVDGSYANVMETLTEINDSLQLIAARNEQIDRLLKIRSLSQDEELNVQILVKLDLLRKNNEQAQLQVNSMRKRVTSYRVENEQLKKMIAKHEASYLEREQELDSLHAYILTLQTAHESLTTDLNYTQSDLANAYIQLKQKNLALLDRKKQLENTLNALELSTEFIEKDAVAFYLIGTAADLRKQGVIGFLTKKKCREGYTHVIKETGKSFSIFAENKIGIPSGQIQYILPERDVNAYYIDNDSLHITNKQAFWQTSKVLAIVITP